jgi:hypothetical protein
MARLPSVATLSLLGLANALTLHRAAARRTLVVRANADAPPANAPDVDEGMMALRTPLRMLGPYPVLSLRFNDMATPEQFKAQQQETGERGVALDFVVDTGANVNTINAKLAADLGLEAVGFDEGGVSATGDLAGGTTFMLGTAQLNDLPREERIDFCGGLTASALPVASPSGAGLLGVGFLFAFPGGVEFDWGDAAAAVSPSLTMFGDMVGTEDLMDGLCEVPARQLESGLVCVTMTINGVEIPSLLDTGSPITVLNAAAAEAAGIAMPQPEATINPFAKAKAAVEAAAAMASGEVAMMGGPNGPITLRKIPEKAPIFLGAADIGAGRPYVGEFPGLAALGGLDADSGPAAVLGRTCCGSGGGSCCRTARSTSRRDRQPIPYYRGGPADLGDWLRPDCTAPMRAALSRGGSCGDC